MHNHMILLDVRRHVLAGQESTDGQHQTVGVAHMHKQQTTDRPLDPSQVRFQTPRVHSLTVV